MINRISTLFCLLFICGLANSQEITSCQLVEKNCGSYNEYQTQFDTNGKAIGSVKTPYSNNCPVSQQRWECDYGTETICGDNVADCSLAKTEETKVDSKGNPYEWEQTWVCEDETTTSCTPEAASLESLKNDDFCRVASEECVTEVGGYCIDKNLTFSCQEPTESCLTSKDDSCSLVDTDCVSQGDDDQGLGCLTEQQTWKCSTETTECVRQEVVNTCDVGSANGLTDFSEVDHTSEIQSVASGMQLLKGIENNISGTPPKVFGGTSRNCTRDLLGQAGLGKNCCSKSTIQGDGSVLDSCTASEELLATARKAGRSKLIAEGDYTRQYIDLFVGGFCSFTEKKREWYCTFDSMLSRIVQEQGREQLKQMASKSLAGGSAVISFPYLAGEGEWSEKTVSGYSIRAFSYPQRCESMTSSDDSTCPDNMRFKIEVKGLGEAHARNISAYEEQVVAVSKGVLIIPENDGAFCNTDLSSSDFGQCRLGIKVWGQDSGSTEVPVIVTKNRYAGSTGWSQSVFGGDDWEFQVWQTVFSEAPIADDEPIKMRWRHSGSGWAQDSLSSPLGPDEGHLLGGNRPVYGKCQNATCNYTVRIPLSITTKPWIVEHHTKQHGCEDRYTINCSGFSLNEFQMLDISKMNLSEWSASIKSKVMADLPDASEYSSAAQDSVGGAISGIATTGVNSPITGADPQATQYSAKLEEGKIFTSDEAKSYAAIEWPQKGSGNFVASASVQWGDGSSDVMSNNGDIFSATHSYNEPGSYKIFVTQKMPSGTEHTKRLRIVVENPESPMPNLGGSPF